MDPNCTSAQLQVCVADLQEYFASAASPAGRRRFASRVDAANNLSDVLQELSGQESAIAQHKDVLLSLTSGLDAVAAATADLGQPGLGSLQPSQGPLSFMGSWYSLLSAAALVAHNLFEYLRPYCSTDAEQEQLAASVATCTGAICTACSRLVQLWRERQSAVASEAASSSVLEITNDCLRLALDVIVIELRAASAASNAGADPAAVAQAAALLVQLRPKRVLGWVRSSLDAVDWVVSTAGVDKSNCLVPLLRLLELLPCSVPLGLGQALYHEPDLISRLARLTPRVHVAAVAAPNWADRDWSERHVRAGLWPADWIHLQSAPENPQPCCRCWRQPAAFSGARCRCWPACRLSRQQGQTHSRHSS
ncbi:hypothetical protein ABPG77_011074 [Micractinium sp. CCAP 211/92]